MGTLTGRLWLGGVVAVAVAAGAFLVWALPGIAGLMAEEDTQVSGTVSKWVGINKTDLQCTSSASYVDMPGMAVTFTTTKPSQRVLLQFQGEWIAPAEVIRAVIDGVPVGGPGSGGVGMIAVHSDNLAETNGFNFISDPVSHPGSHTAKIQWADRYVGGSCVRARSLIVIA